MSQLKVEQNVVTYVILCVIMFGHVNIQKLIERQTHRHIKETKKSLPLREYTVL